MDGALFGSKKDNASFRRKLVGINCMEAIYTRFPGFRLPPPLPNGNAFRALPIGARGIGKSAVAKQVIFAHGGILFFLPISKEPWMAT
ncbi:MAG TPA: hypothetical protein DCZ76_06690 [Treponema sp.]|nr:hypothetical protein [Treponema sp.]